MNSKFTRIAVAAALGTVLVAAAGVTATTAATGPAWTYTGATGPSHWGSLDASYIACVDGSAQSPINIVKPKPTPLANLKFSYAPTEAGIFNNGHTVEAEPLGGEAPTLTLNSTKYSFAQFHFHAPSEHEINGMHYPVEVHFVHKTADGKLAVVGVFVKAGAENEEWKVFTDKMLAANANPESTTVELDWAKLLPKKATTVRYDGSLTTPACSEGVKWNVFTTPVTMSQEQINTFLEAYSGNNRPVQPLKGRKVVIDSTLTK